MKGDSQMGISQNIKDLRQRHSLTQAEFGEIAGVSDKAVSTWENGTAEPRMGAIQKIADYFGISKADLLEDTPDDEPTYYLDDDAKDLAEFMFNNPEYKVLFDASRNVSKKDIEFVKQMIDRMSGNYGD